MVYIRTLVDVYNCPILQNAKSKTNTFRFHVHNAKRTCILAISTLFKRSATFLFLFYVRSCMLRLEKPLKLDSQVSGFYYVHTVCIMRHHYTHKYL